MNKQLQTVFIPTKVDEDIIKSEVCGVSEHNELLVGYINKSEHSHTGYEISDDEQNLTGITHWLKPTKGYFFTPEELKQLLEEYTNRIVENVYGNTFDHDLYVRDYFSTENSLDIDMSEGTSLQYGCSVKIDKESITNQLPLMLKELGI